jgi:hypothetical protein
MRRSRLVGAIVVLLVGLTFFLQGIGLLGGSRMTGSTFWAVVGGIAVIAAVGILALERRRAGGA